MGFYIVKTIILLLKVDGNIGILDSNQYTGLYLNFKIPKISNISRLWTTTKISEISNVPTTPEPIIRTHISVYNYILKY